jgi:hypothetical protein
MRGWPGALALVAALALTAPASAREASVWVKCDGLAKPEGAGVTLGRLVAITATMGIAGAPEGSTYTPAASGADGVAACTEALASPDLSRWWVRHVSLLRWRAIHRIEAGDSSDAALQDLRAIGALAAQHEADAGYNRSIGLSVKLLEAALLAKKGEQAEANRLAYAVAEERPYATNLVGLAAAIAAVDPTYSADKDRLLTRYLALDPDARRLRAEARDWADDPNGAADDWLFLLESGESSLPQIGRDRFPASMARVVELMNAPPAGNRDGYFLTRATVAAAHANRAELARTLITELSQRIADAEKPEATAPPASPAAGQAPAAAPNPMEAYRRRAEAAQMRGAARFVAVAEAWLAVHANQAPKARSLMESLDSVPITPSVVTLLKRLDAMDRPNGPSSFDNGTIEGERASLRIRRAANLDLERYAKALPALEQIDDNAFKRGAERERPGAGASKRVSFRGAYNASPAAVEEMALLHAAQRAQAAGSAGLIVLSRTDLQRFVQQTMYGTPTGPATPTGYETNLEVRYVDPAALPADLAGHKDRVLDTAPILASLTPLYVREQPERRR